MIFSKLFTLFCFVFSWGIEQGRFLLSIFYVSPILQILIYMNIYHFYHKKLISILVLLLVWGLVFGI